MFSEHRHILESIYQHVSNGGVSVKIDEELDGARAALRLHFSVANHGYDMKGSIPLISQRFTRLLGEALLRAADKVTTDPHDAHMEQQVYVRHKAGYEYAAIYSDEIVASRYSTERRLLGHNLVDDAGQIVGFEPADQERVTCSGVCGGDPIYAEEDIGKPVQDVR